MLQVLENVNNYKGVINMKFNLKAWTDMTKIKVKSASPTICLIGGIVTSAIAIGLTIKASLDVNYILDERKEKINEIQETLDNENRDFEYTEEDAAADIKTANGRCVLSFVKAYGPALGFYCLSLVLFVSGNRILEKRNLALATTVNTLQTFLAGYRERVASFVGEDKERDIYNGLRKVKKVDEETGEELEVEEFDPNANKVFDRIFDETMPGFSKEPWDNQNNIYAWERSLNLELQERYALDGQIGILTLNEALQKMSLPLFPEGYNMCWYYTDDHRTQIDFGTKGDKYFTNGLEQSVWLHFNVDGDVNYILKNRGIKEIAA